MPQENTYILKDKDLDLNELLRGNPDKVLGKIKGKTIHVRDMSNVYEGQIITLDESGNPDFEMFKILFELISTTYYRKGYVSDDKIIRYISENNLNKAAEELEQLMDNNKEICLPYFLSNGKIGVLYLSCDLLKLTLYDPYSSDNNLTAEQENIVFGLKSIHEQLTGSRLIFSKRSDFVTPEDRNQAELFCLFYSVSMVKQRFLEIDSNLRSLSDTGIPELTVAVCNLLRRAKTIEYSASNSSIDSDQENIKEGPSGKMANHVVRYDPQPESSKGEKQKNTYRKNEKDQVTRLTYEQSIRKIEETERSFLGVDRIGRDRTYNVDPRAWERFKSLEEILVYICPVDRSSAWRLLREEIMKRPQVAEEWLKSAKENEGEDSWFIFQFGNVENKRVILEIYKQAKEPVF